MTNSCQAIDIGSGSLVMPSNVRAASVIKGQITHATSIRKIKFNKSHTTSTQLQ